jgi:hypothetical protein
MKIDVTTGAEVIKGVEIGVEPDAKVGLDTYDERSPRGLGKPSEVLLQREEWDKDYPAFASDIRPGINGVEKWKMTVASRQNEKVTMKIENIQSVPSQYQVYLIDEDGKVNQDLRKNTVYEFESQGANRELLIIVGEPNLVKSEAEKNLPSEIKVGPNYPNPFNPETVIPIELPKTMEVKITIYDILGRTIKTLYDGMMESGRHYLRWDGKDSDGNLTASGIYLYRMQTASGIHSTHKIMLMR